MKIELDLTISNSELAKASRKLGEQIAKAAGEDYDQQKHGLKGFEVLREKMEAEANKAALEVLTRV